MQVHRRQSACFVRTGLLLTLFANGIAVAQIATPTVIEPQPRPNPAIPVGQIAESVASSPMIPTTAESVSIPTIRENGWYFNTEAQLLKRRRTDERSFVVRPDTKETLLSTTDFDQKFAVGPRLTIGRELSDAATLEFTTFWQGGFSDHASITKSTMTMVQPFFNMAYYSPMPPIGAFPTVVELDYQTQIASFELNYKRWIFGNATDGLRTGLMFGPRYISFNEQFRDYDDLNIARGLTDADTVYRTWVTNNLIGGTFGAMFEYRAAGRWTFNQETKFSGFLNATRATNELDFQNGAQVFRASTDETRFSGNIELSLGVRWQAKPWLELAAGYRAIYLWSMTSSPDVISFNLLNQSKQNNELAFWLHGPSAGLVAHF